MVDIFLNMTSTLPAGWQSKLSKSSQKLYYINCYNNKTQWSLPTEPAQSSSSASFRLPSKNVNPCVGGSSEDEEDPFIERKNPAKVSLLN